MSPHACQRHSCLVSCQMPDVRARKRMVISWATEARSPLPPVMMEEPSRPGPPVGFETLLHTHAATAAELSR